MAGKRARDDIFDGLDELSEVNKFFRTEPSHEELKSMEENNTKKFKGWDYDMGMSPNAENEGVNVPNTDKVLTPQVVKHSNQAQTNQQFTLKHGLKFDLVWFPDATCITWADKRNIEHDIEVLIGIAKADRSQKDVVERLNILLKIKKKNDAWLLREYNQMNKQFGLTSKRFDFGHHLDRDFETKIKLLDKNEIMNLEYDATRLHWIFSMKPDNVVYKNMKIGENVHVLEQRYNLTNHILKLYHKLKKTWRESRKDFIDSRLIDISEELQTSGTQPTKHTYTFPHKDHEQGLHTVQVDITILWSQ